MGFTVHPNARGRCFYGRHLLQVLRSPPAHPGRCPALPCRRQASGQSRREQVLALLLSGPSVWSSPSLLRGAGDNLVWKVLLGLRCLPPPRALLRPRAVLAIQMPTTFCPPAPVAQPPVSVSILHEPLSPSTTKNPLPATPASILDFPRGEGLPHALGNLRSVFFPLAVR